ncbi:M4 family metallopeptidase [Bradyrhizobium tropiciagri]|uniref:M4 family metallopeptidase n=1 Tax=Bradyrhizobium tropiciagri TaxID=312253 RepID=UPI001BA876E1|nr:M4 family metallopeptidase [Bradyrhizobium tropiciagri]MBR0869320.1 M4 family metallopeptidase [Bradyrhizobium tropiciagri]
MARSTKAAKAKRTTKKAAKKKRAGTAAAYRASGFKSLAMHVTEQDGRRTFEALRSERPATSTFSLAVNQPENVDPESAAKRILDHALASKAMPSLTAPVVDGTESSFKSLGVETVPLTGTSIVKFRQQVKGIPVYGSLVSVELGDKNEMVSLNSNLAEPDVKSYVAKISPQDALKKIAAEAGYGRELPERTPVLNLYYDQKGKWHLAYVVEDVRSRKKSKTPGRDMPLIYDYVVDALTGALVAELPRTPTETSNGMDELGNDQTFGIVREGSKKVMRDDTLNIETYDFSFGDPERADLPGNLVAHPFSSAAVSAHCNATIVAKFLRDVLKRNNIDNMGGRMISTVNCVVKRFEQPPAGSKIWLNAFWDGTQMVYGQAKFDGKLRSLSAALDVVAHELFHGVTGDTARLVYLGETGALNESYSDIFGIIISNVGEPDMEKWNWLIGDGISSGLEALRDMEDPTRFGQPKLMSNFVVLPLTEQGDSGGVHTNSGIHNFAAFKVMTAKDGDGFLFKPSELAAIFYIALTQQLSRQSTFSDSRRGVVLATRSLFRTLPQDQIDARVAAVEAGFNAAGIR